jgi:hypothetical protein
VRRVFKSYPPLLGHVKVPVGSRTAAAAATLLYTPSKPLPALLHRVGHLLVKMLGPGVLPGRAVPWDPPIAEADWEDLLAGIRQTSGPFDSFAVHERRQRARKGFTMLLLQGGRAVAFVRLQRGRSERFTRERQALELLSRSPLSLVETARPLAAGMASEWSFLATSALSIPVHRVPRAPPIDRIALEISQALESLDRPQGTPPDWLPMHGDFTPWNLRETRGGRLLLFDWEHAGWAPPGADVVLYRATEATLRRTPFATEFAEAAAYWCDRLGSTTAITPKELRFAAQLRNRLALAAGVAWPLPRD